MDPEEDLLRELPSLEPLTFYDAALRQHPNDPEQVSELVLAAERRLERARARQGARTVLRLLVYLGEAERVLGRREAAIARHRQALAVARELGDHRFEVGSLIRLGEAHRYAEDQVTAESLFRAALGRVEADRERLGVYEDFALQHLGKCLIEQARAAEAIACLERALELRQTKGDAGLIASTEAALHLARQGLTPRSPGQTTV